MNGIIPLPFHYICKNEPCNQIYTTRLALGLAPFVACATLYYVTPYIVTGNPGALLSFAVLGLYVFSSIAVLVVSIILLVRKKTVIGAVAIVSVFAQAMVAVGLLANA